MAARRILERFSPGAKPAEPARVPLRAAPGHLRHRLESRTRWITAAASPLLVTAFFQEPVWLAANLLGFGLIWTGMAMTREGLQAEAAYDARTTARRPAYPRKLIGGLTAGAGLAVGAAEPGSLVGAGVIGAVGAVLHTLSFGTDPMRDKGLEGVDQFQQDRVARVVAEAERHLASMQTAIARTNDDTLIGVVDDFARKARRMAGRIEDDPAQLNAARRYLGVWLLGARDATVRFADLYVASKDAEARLSWLALMADLTNEFAARQATMIEGGRTDMDIEVAVLRERLAREGLASAPSTRFGAARPGRATTAAPAGPAQLRDERGLDDLFAMPERAREPAEPPKRD